MALGISMFNRTQGHAPQGADWREAAKEVKTEPPAAPGLLASVVKKLPLDVAAKSAKRANDRVVVAEADVARAELALEQVVRENADRLSEVQGFLTKRKAALEQANDDLVKAQMNFISEAREQGALERTGPLMEFLARGASDDDVVPTVALGD